MACLTLPGFQASSLVTPGPREFPDRQQISSTIPGDSISFQLSALSSRKSMASTSSPTAAGSVGRPATTREGTAKAMVADHISLAVQSTSNLLQLMQQSSPSQARLMKLPRNLLAKTSTIKNTAQVLEQMPRVISSLDAHLENGLQSVPHLKTVTQLLSNMESSQLNYASHVLQSQEINKVADKLPE